MCSHETWPPAKTQHRRRYAACGVSSSSFSCSSAHAHERCRAAPTSRYDGAMMFTHAIVRPPAANFADGLTNADLGKPDLTKALDQHAHYCAALERCGLALTYLPTDADFPDSTFVEDTAVAACDFAILARPGAAARAGEVAGIEPALRAAFPRIDAIAAPGTLD